MIVSGDPGAVSKTKEVLSGLVVALASIPSSIAFAGLDLVAHHAYLH